MNFLADEGVDFPIVQRLRSDGHEVLYVAEMEPGISDEKILALTQSIILATNKDAKGGFLSPHQAALQQMPE